MTNRFYLIDIKIGHHNSYAYDPAKAIKAIMHEKKHYNPCWFICREIPNKNPSGFVNGLTKFTVFRLRSEKQYNYYKDCNDADFIKMLAFSEKFETEEDIPIIIGKEGIGQKAREINGEKA